MPSEPSFEEDEGEVTGINDGLQEASFKLEQNYPNPFHNSTTIGYELKKPGYISLALYDMAGKKVSVLVEDRKAAGTYQLKLSKQKFKSGLYYYKLTADGRSKTRRMLIGN